MAGKTSKPVENDPLVDTARQIIQRHNGDLHAAIVVLDLILSHPGTTPGARRAAVKVWRIIRDKIALN